ncbi:ABC transporter permease subunit [Leptospira interrogans]|uniref:ABC transporter, permease protein n=2 Tax=Leptospira interrogans TaxID=173 RepID=M6HHH5_LEPIR|nr:ABC transporter permease subunit [Leptospira interrogans]EMF41674.1 ABC transporter, permease protein [Leptospira interrogans serovar Lora str. TE 1992]EMM94359.1 ABC transporter, permease protein [Leptospira interrogans serovar Zanoni str. LT2156]AKH78360.1 ABC transporter permease [Leptospira interrogans serovar Bratislava]EMN10786.1 ABC transporter, permease protein [Leptospira interrogans serovar Muenchen str. Brem 129]KLO76143.1 ABC transporter, permease protein [Leptospira interrogans
MQGEISRFLLFFVALIFFSVLFGHLRSLNKEYLYADSFFSKEESFLEQKSFSSKIFSFVKGIIMFQSSKTTSGESVWKHIFSRILPTLHLAVFSVGWGSFFAVTLALVSSKKEEGIFKNIFLFLSNWILSTPVFVVGVVLLLIFFVQLEWFPPGGYEPWNSTYVVLPGIALGSRVWARIYQFALSLTEIELKSPYIKVLRARGYSKNRILWNHILLKILPLLVVLILLDFSSLLSGAMIVEEIFFFPGIGKSMYYAIQTMDAELLSALLFYSGLTFYIFSRVSIRFQESLTGKENLF